MANGSIKYESTEVSTENL